LALSLFRGLSFSDDTFLYLSLLLVDVSPASLLRRICSFVNLSFFIIYARSLVSSYSIVSSERPSIILTDFCILNRAPIPELSGSSVARVTRFGGITHA
jgi:hypothetical protein